MSSGRAQRLADAIEGELDGLAIDLPKAAAILEHVDAPIGKDPQVRIDELLETTNRYLAEARAARALVRTAFGIFGQICDLSTALRHGGAALEDLEDLAESLEKAVDLANEGYGELAPVRLERGR